MLESICACHIENPARRRGSRGREVRTGLLVLLAVLSLWLIFWNTRPPDADVGRVPEEVQIAEPLSMPPGVPENSPESRVDDRELDEQPPEVLVLVQPAPRKRRWPRSLNLDDPLPGTQSSESKE